MDSVYQNHPFSVLMDAMVCDHCGSEIVDVAQAEANYRHIVKEHLKIKAKNEKVSNIQID